MGKREPENWLGCPKTCSQLIADKFFCFKTPLSQNLNNSLPLEERFTIQNVFESFKQLSKGGKTLKIWINITSFDEYFDSDEIENAGIEYHHLPVFRDSGDSPNQHLLKKFQDICKSVGEDGVIGVHCIHGLNRTGFLISTYLTEFCGVSIDEAILCFKANRPPGIYRESILHQLVDRYGGSENSKIPPIQPEWIIQTL